MTAPLSTPIEDAIGEETAEELREQVAEQSADEQAPRSTAEKPSSLRGKLAELIARRAGYVQLTRLASHRGDIRATLDKLPDRMHRAAKQTRLMLELVEDFRRGEYREIPWRSVAVGAGALLYVVSPVDVLPDVLMAFGALDDLAVLSVAARLIRDDLKRYCEHKGYDPEDYFGPTA